MMTIQDELKKKGLSPTGRLPSAPKMQNLPGTPADLLDKLYEQGKLDGDGVKSGYA